MPRCGVTPTPRALMARPRYLQEGCQGLTARSRKGDAAGDLKLLQSLVTQNQWPHRIACREMKLPLREQCSRHGRASPTTENK